MRWSSIARSPSIALVLIATLSLPSAAGARVPEAPPRPVVVADGGAHRQAARGSYCWTYGGGGVCADTIDPIEVAAELSAPAESTITVRMGYPVERLGAYTADGELDLVALDDRRRKYELTLPRSRPGGRLDIYLQAAYDRGDGLFAIRIRPR